jgi:hypothetical protein
MSPFIALTIAISGSRPWTINTARFYRESAALRGYPRRRSYDSKAERTAITSKNPMM